MKEILLLWACSTTVDRFIFLGQPHDTKLTTMTQNYNLEQVIIIKSVLNCMISYKSSFCQAHITLAGQ